jgi:hypothetical protein
MRRLSLMDNTCRALTNILAGIKRASLAILSRHDYIIGINKDLSGLTYRCAAAAPVLPSILHLRL